MRLKKLHKRIAILCIASFLMASLLVPALAGEREATAAHTQSELNDMYVLGLFSHDWSTSTMPSSAQQQMENARIDVRWPELEPTDNNYVWTKLDNQINTLRARGIQNILLSIDRVPAWAGGGSSQKHPPTDILQWKQFCGDLAKHCHDDLGDVVDFYEIWNEPGWDVDSQAAQTSGTVHFSGQVETDYLPMLQAAYAAIKTYDPTSWVICGALNYSVNPNDLPGQATLYGALFNDVNRAGLDNSVQLHSDQPVIAERPMYFNYKGAWTGGHDVVGATASRENWYFAEGTTRDGFEEYLCLQNPGASTASVQVDYMMMPGSGTNKTVIYPVAPHSRFTVYVNGVVGTGKDVAMQVTSTGNPIIAERPMYFDYLGMTGGHDVLGAAEPKADWYFAEGTTRDGFQEYLCLQNPGDTATTATVHFMTQGGESGTLSVPIAAKARNTILVNAEQPPGTDVSLWVHANSNIICERPMYFNYAGAWTGGHDVVGVNGTSTSWYFAEGTTRGGFDEYLCLQNPNSTMASGTIRFMTGAGQVIDLPFSVNPNSRSTVWVNQAVGPEQDVSMQVTSNIGIIAERPMYFAYKGYITGGHDVMGASGASYDWFFAEGFAGSGFEQYICLQNPGAATANVTVTYMMKNGDTIGRLYQVPAHSRSTVSVNFELGMRSFCDAVAVHPYVSPENWGAFCNYVNAALAGDGVFKQLVATEIGWPSQADNNPADPADHTADYYNESEQSRILGMDGLGTLWSAGVRKVWVYEDIDDAPGTSWDRRYYGLFRFNGSAKPAWNQYLFWQSQGY